ncbi:MAG: hypothetical protein J6U20_14825 [Fibrobacter sp.]|nr:hypothetical protein [Fibrobacter sp.]
MKKGLFVFFILACMAWSSESIRVEVKDEQPTNVQMLGLRLRIVNNSGQQYDGIQVKYYLKKQPADNLELQTYYMGNLSAQLEEFDDTTVVLKVNVPVLGTGNTPDATGISVGVHRSGWGSIHKESLSGYPGTEFAEAARYGVYLSGNLIAGNLLPDEPSEGTLKLRFVGLRPETTDSASPWVQIQNYGESTVSLNGVKIKDASGNLYSLGGMTLGAKSTLRVCSGQISDCSFDSVVTSISGLSFGNVGEFVLYRDSIPLDYIAWGNRGYYADSLETENKVIDPDFFFKTSMEDGVGGPASIYHKGDFFRAVIMDGNDSIVCWNKFREKMVASPFSQMPYAEPFSLRDSSSIYKHNMEETMLAWIPVAGAKFYEVIVLNASDTTLIYHDYTERTRIPLQLGEGEYFWVVNPVDDGGNLYGGAGLTTWNTYIPLNYYCYFEVNVLDGTETPVYNLHVDPLAARKDSYMLDLKWGEHIIEADWDRPHNSSGYVDGFGNRRFHDLNHYYNDPEESWRCWAVAAAMVNHKYGGNLTQDEIKFHFSSLDPILNAFPHDEDGGGSFGTVIPWVMNLDPNAGEFTYSSGIPSDEILLGALAAGNLVVVFEVTHFMVIDAVVYSNKKHKYVYRFLNIDNDGTVSWRRPEDKGVGVDKFAYWIMSDPRLYGKMARKSELYEDKNNNGVMDFDEIFDADGDTLLDFDERHRFNTNPYYPDSDYDGVPDKTEIMSYTIREHYPEKTADGKDFGVKNEIYANIDGDVDGTGAALRAELDPDSDNDGRLDGQEDINANGLRDNYETDVYAKDADQVVAMSNAEHVTLYALSELRYNDGVVCYNGRMQTGRCIIASAALGLNGEYAVNVGARADVGDILSRGNVILRSNTHVRGGVYLIEGSNVDDIFLQNGATIDKGISRYTYDVWDLNFYPRNYAVDDLVIPFVYDFVVHDGEVRVLSSGIYSTVKVEGGGLLYIPPGTVYTGSIQLDPRSNVMFNLPGRETVIHVSGDFTWRAKTLNEPEQYPFIAQGFKLVQHARGKRMYVENMVAGSIVAPYSDVIVAQSRKLFYGKIFANKITVHQYAKIYHVDFSPIETDLVLTMGGI